MKIAAMWVVGCALVPAASLAAADPYAALARLNGKWEAISSTGAATEVENHCTRTGRFFVCEQLVNGKTAALLVLMPDGTTEKEDTYLVQTLTPTGRKPGLWRTLTIEGDNWVYADTAPTVGEKTPRQRTINQYLGPDHIRYELQGSTNGKTWTTLKSGDERRAP